MSPKIEHRGESSDQAMIDDLHDHDDERGQRVIYDRKGQRLEANGNPMAPPAQPQEVPPSPPIGAASEDEDQGEPPLEPDPNAKGGEGADRDFSDQADTDERKVDFDEAGNLAHDDFEGDDATQPGTVFGDLNFKQDEPEAAVVTSDPPDRTPEEQAFSSWLHSYPIHEGEREFEYMKTLGVEDTHQPEDEDDDEESAPPDLRSQGEVVAPDGRGQDFSYLDDWGGGGEGQPPVPKGR